MATLKKKKKLYVHLSILCYQDLLKNLSLKTDKNPEVVKCKTSVSSRLLLS